MTAPSTWPDPLDYPLVDIPRIDQTRTTPVVALDLDGVLNPLGEHLPTGASRVPVCIPAWATADAAFLVGHGRQNVRAQVAVDQEHGDWIRRLLARGVDVVWCTSWETAAPIVYGLLLGLPPLPVVLLDGGTARDSTQAKAQALEGLFPQRALVWLDDTSHDRPYLQRHPAWPTLVPRISGMHGLIPQIRDEVEVWLDAHPVGFPRYVDELPVVENGEWKIHTGQGSLRLLAAPGHAPVARFGSKLRAAHNLPATVDVMWQADIRIGETLRLRREDNGQEIALDRTTSIECLRIVDLADIPQARPGRYPDLAGQRRAQLLISEALAPHPECVDVAVRDGRTVRFQVGDTLLELDLTGDIAVLQAYLPGPQGGSPHRWVDIAFERPWRFTEMRGVGAGLPRIKPETASWMLTQWQAWDRRQHCEHPDSKGRPYCPACGALGPSK